MNFEKYSPCIYYGETLCADCEQHKRCDMEAGRELHRKCYEDGQSVGNKRIKELESALKGIAPWLSASLNDTSREHPCQEYVDACNAVFFCDVPSVNGE